MAEICTISKEQYKIIQNSDKRIKEVLYTYRFNRVYINRFYVFPKVDKKDDNYYIEKAKQKVEIEKKNGELAKYSFKYIDNLKIVRKKKIVIACVIPVVICGLGVGGVYLTKFLTSLPIPPIGDAKAIEVSSNILAEISEGNTMNILLSHAKTGKIVMTSTHTPYEYEHALSESHTIDFDFTDGEFYFKDTYDDNSSVSDNDTVNYYLYRPAKGKYQSGVYNFYIDIKTPSPDGTGTLDPERAAFPAASIEEAITNFAEKTLNKLTFVTDQYTSYNYEWHFLGVYPLVETSLLDPLKAKVVSSQATHPDSYIKTSFYSDGRTSITTNLDFVYYENDERYYENFQAVITNKLCYECRIVTETGNLPDRYETTYKFTPSDKTEKDAGYKDWKLNGEEIEYF